MHLVNIVIWRQLSLLIVLLERCSDIRGSENAMAAQEMYSQIPACIFHLMKYPKSCLRFVLFIMIVVLQFISQ